MAFPWMAIPIVMSAISSMTAQEQQPEDISPYSEDFMKQLQSYIEQNQSQATQANQQVASSQAKAASIGNDMGQTVDEIKSLETPDPNAFFNQFMQNIPGYQEIASQTAAESTRVAGRDVTQQAEFASKLAGQQAANSIPGGSGFSGAQSQAVGQATATPIAQAMAQLAQLSGQNYSSTFNNLAGSGQQLAYQGQQQGFENALNALMGGLQAQNAQAGVFGNIAGQDVTMANQANQSLNNLMSLLSQNAGPTYSLPTMTNPMDGFLNMGTNIGLMGSMMSGSNGNSGNSNYSPLNLSTNPYDNRTNGGGVQ